jgi:hypothetical protein
MTTPLFSTPIGLITRRPRRRRRYWGLGLVARTVLFGIGVLVALGICIVLMLD